jgi:hypothetical protein
MVMHRLTDQLIQTLRLAANMTSSISFRRVSSFSPLLSRARSAINNIQATRRVPSRKLLTRRLIARLYLALMKKPTTKGILT